MTTPNGPTSSLQVDAVAYYALDRDADLSGISGLGRIAYAIELPTGVLLVWDTQWITVDWRPSLEVLNAIHGHHGATRITPLEPGSPGVHRAQNLLQQVIGRALVTFSQAVDLRVGREG